MTGIAMVASTIGAAGIATNEDALRRNPAMRDAEERIRQLEAQLRRERQQLEGAGAGMFAAVRDVLQVTQARRRLNYVDGLIYIAVVGAAGSGKSSLINSIRGLREGDPGAAAVGTSETAKEMGPYKHPDATKHPFVWYEFSGADTPGQPDARYFLDQGLFMFDCIIVVFDQCLTAADIAIVKCCQTLDIPVYIVRSKALERIQNKLDEISRGRLNSSNKETYQEIERMKLMRDTERIVAGSLKAAELDEQRVYLVDSRTVLQVVNEEDTGSSLLHESELQSDVLEVIRRRERGPPQAGERRA